MSDDGNRNKNNRNRRPKGGGDNRDRNRGGDRKRGGRGPRRDGGNDRRGAGSQQRGQGGGRQRPAPKVEFEYLIATPQGSIAAPVYATDIPPSWREIPPVMFFKEGVFLRAQGAVKAFAKKLSFEKAVVYAVWEDPSATFRFGGQEVRPGVTAAALVPSSLDEGPPWIPIQANVASPQREMEEGFMSPSLDQVSPVSFEPTFRVQKNRLTIASGSAVVADQDPLRETLRWLVENPEDQSLPAKVARTALVRNGHGLQRFGISLMHRSSEEKSTAVREILRPLAPELADVLEPVWEIFAQPELLDPKVRHESIVPLAKALDRALGKNAHLQSARGLSLTVAWIAGLFGIRAEKSGRQPARLLFATLRALRSAGRQMQALEHVDSPLPVVPFGRGATDALIRDLSKLPREESNFERLIRALAIAECGWSIARPRRDHLRPFRIVYPFVRGYPNAARSLVGRYDHIFTGWSFRGSELRDDGVKPDWLAGVFLTDSPSVTSVRAFARVVATPTPTGGFVSEGLKSTDHPTLKAIGSFRDEGDESISAGYTESLSHEKITYLRLQRSVAAAEYLIAKSEVGELSGDFTLLPPHSPDSGGVRGHFMYWRMFCRSIAWKLPDVYRDFLDEIGPTSGELVPKLQTELFALVRRWAMHSDEHRAHAQSWGPWLRDAVTRYFDTAEKGPLDGEWLDVLSAALAACDREGTTGLLARLCAEDGVRVGHIERLLDGVRSAGWRRELVTDPAFAAAHAVLVPSRAADAQRARVEWVRSSLERSRNFDSVRWMLDSRSYPAITGSEEFRAWFENRGLATVQDPDAALVELLELAVRLVSDEHLDIALRALDARTLWPASEHVRALSELGRPEAVVGRLRLALTGTEDEHATAVAGLFEQPGGLALQRAAQALAHFDVTRTNTELSNVLADGLRGAFAQYTPHRHALAGFRAACDGWITAGLGAAEPAGALAAHAAKFTLETGDTELCAFVGHIADVSVAELLEPALISAIGGDDAALGTAFLALNMPEPLTDAMNRALEGGKSAHARALRGALGGAHSNGILDALVARVSLQTAQAGTPLSDLGGRLSALAELGPSASDTSGGDQGAQFVARRLETLAKTLTSALKRWSLYVGRIEVLGEETLELWTRASRYRPGTYRLRADLLSRIGGSRDDLRTVKDPRRLLTSDFLDSDTLYLDAADFVALADGLRKLAFRHEGDPTLIVDRRNVGVKVPNPAPDEKSESVGEIDGAVSTEAPAEVAPVADIAQEEAPAPIETAAGSPPNSADTDDAESPEAAADKSGADAPTQASTEEPAAKTEPDAEAVPEDEAPDSASAEPADEPSGDETSEVVVSGPADAAKTIKTIETDDADAETSVAAPENASESAPNKDAADSQVTEAATDETVPSDGGAEVTESDAPKTRPEKKKAPQQRAKPSKTLQKSIQSAYGVESGAEARAELFGEPGIPVLLRHLAKRSGVQVGFGKVKNQPGVTLKWDRSSRL